MEKIIELGNIVEEKAEPYREKIWAITDKNGQILRMVSGGSVSFKGIRYAKATITHAVSGSLALDTTRMQHYFQDYSGNRHYFDHKNAGKVTEYLLKNDILKICELGVIE